MTYSFVEMIENHTPIIFDGGLGTEIQKYPVSDQDTLGKRGCNEILNLTRPDILEAIHTSYCEAGAHVIETNTFGANRIKLEEYGLVDKLEEINRQAVLIAQKAIMKSKTPGPHFICGSLGPTGHLLSSPKASGTTLTFDDYVALFQQQATVLIEAGVDLLILETMHDLLEVRAILCGIRKAFTALGKTLPIQVQVTMDAQGRMLLGSDIPAFLGAVANLSPTVIGLNCSTGPQEMLPLLEKLANAVPCALSMIPNAGMPENVDGQAVYRMEPADFVKHSMFAVKELGVTIVGGCCGTTPEHIQALSQALATVKVKKRTILKATCFLSTGISGIALHDKRGLMLIGERLNTQGSKKTKELVLADNYEELYQIALEQINKNADLIDLCMAVNERDSEPETMAALVRYLSDRVGTPFCIDSTDPTVIEAGIKHCPGSLLINSINLEHNGDRARSILTLAKQFGCPVIALPIDDKGMAGTVEQKLALCKKIVDLVCEEFGLPIHYIFFDPLVFTLATGDKNSADAAKNSLAALQQIKEQFPGIRTAMGVSNVSYGLKPNPRRILNNLMLHHAVEAGLDAAIFNPLHFDSIDSYDKEVVRLGENLLFNHNENALVEYIHYFDAQTAKQPQKSDTSDKIASGQQVPLEKQLYNKILLRDRRDLTPLLESLLKEKLPGQILDEILLPAMTEVGDKLASGDMILPFVLQAAEVMKEAIHILEPFFAKEEMKQRGTIVLATVFGDVHDIGKNLVGSIMKNQGFRVIDLGKQVPLKEIIAAVENEKPDAIGLSALLVTTSREMEGCVKELYSRGYSIPVLIGGAAVNAKFAQRIEKVGQNKVYGGGVFYARNAFEAAKIIDAAKEKTGSSVRLETEMDSTDTNEEAVDIVRPEPLDFPESIVPPFYGTSEILTWDAQHLLDSIDTQKLFKKYWRAGRLDEKTFAEYSESDFKKAFKQLSEEIVAKELLDPRGFYGFYPVITEDNNCIVLNPTDFHTEITSFNFSRIKSRNWRCFADYFRPESDTITFQIVTVGAALSERCRELFQKEELYTLGFYLHGIGTYLTEELAEKVTTEIRRGFGLPSQQGKRFSFGYKGLDELSEQKKIFEIMCIEDRLGITLTEGFQMVPEHSTLGIFASHKEAEYF